MKKNLRALLLLAIIAIGVLQFWYVSVDGEQIKGYKQSDNGASCLASSPECGTCFAPNSPTEVIGGKCYKNATKLYGFPIKDQSQTDIKLFINLVGFIVIALLVGSVEGTKFRKKVVKHAKKRTKSIKKKAVKKRKKRKK